MLFKIREFIIGVFEKLLRARFVGTEKVALVFEEVHLARFFKHYKVDCVFDVGANEGQYVAMLRTRVGYQGPIISFEPIPAAAEMLRKKAAADPQWYIEEAALDEASHETTFNIMQGSQFSSLHDPTTKEVDLFAERNKTVEKVRVTTKTIEEMFKKYSETLHFKKPFLKMDTQGNDLRVAKGAGKDLEAFTGIQSELSIKPIYEDAPDYRKAIEYYASRGFELSAFVPNNEGHFPRLIEIDGILYNKNLNP